MNELNGKRALVTGASRGIGLAIAKKLSEYGVSVVLAARNIEEIDVQVRELKRTGAEALAVQCDVSKFHDVDQAVKAAIDAWGSLDILVNNAGTIDPIDRLTDGDPNTWARAIDINIKGVYFGMRAALQHMEAQGRGVVVNMSSGAANSALEGWSHYCTSKAAVKKLTECAHKEMAEKGVRIVGLSPGTVATDMMAQIKNSGINPVSQLDWSTHIPAEWAAEAVAFLCCDEAKEFDGTDFSIKTDEGRQRVGLPIQ